MKCSKNADLPWKEIHILLERVAKIEKYCDQLNVFVTSSEQYSEDQKFWLEMLTEVSCCIKISISDVVEFYRFNYVKLVLFPCILRKQKTPKQRMILIITKWNNDKSEAT